MVSGVHRLDALSPSIVGAHAGPNMASGSFDMLFMLSVSRLFVGPPSLQTFLLGFDATAIIPD